MGLLDDITDSLGGAGMDANGKAALKQGLLTMGLNMMSGKGTLASVIGQSGLQGANAYQNTVEQQKRQAMQDLQMKQAQQGLDAGGLSMQQTQQQIDAAKRAAEQQQRQQQFIQNMPSPGMQASQAALAGGGGPTQANAQRIAPVDPQQSQLFDAVRAGVLPLTAYLDATRKDTSPLTLKEGEMLVDRRTYKPLATGAQKASDIPSSYREWQFAGGDASGKTYAQWVKDKTPSTSVNVSMDKGFGDTFAKDAAASLAASRDKARGAVQTLQALDRIDAAVSGGAITGPGSDFQSTALRIGSALGVNGKDTNEKLQKTADLIQAQSQLAIGGAQMLAGQGQITDRERDLVNRAAGGDIQRFSAPEIKQLTGVLRKINAQTIDQHNGMLQQVDPKFKQFTPFYQVPMPTARQPMQRIGPGSMGFGGVGIPDAGSDGWGIKLKGQ